METLVITIRDEEKSRQLEQMLRDTEGVERVERLHAIDEATLMAQPSLTEEWNGIVPKINAGILCSDDSCSHL